MSTLHEVRPGSPTQLPALIEKYDVPAAAVAVLADGEVVDDAAGVLSRATGVRGHAPTRSSRSGRSPSSGPARWSCSSSTRAWSTSTCRSARYLPEFRIADEAAAAVITTRQLLSHTAGFEGDIFTDTGLGDDCRREVPRRARTRCPSCSRPASSSPTTTPASACSAGSSRCSARSRTTRACASTSSRRSASPTPPPARTRRSCSAPRWATSSRSPAPGYEPAPGLGAGPLERARPARCSRCGRATCSPSPRCTSSDGRAADGTQVLAPGTAARDARPRRSTCPTSA